MINLIYRFDPISDGTQYNSQSWIKQRPPRISDVDDITLSVDSGEVRGLMCHDVMAYRMVSSYLSDIE